MVSLSNSPKQKEIENKLVDNGVDMNTVIVGVGKTYYKNHRLMFPAGKRKDYSENTEFVIKYFSEHDIYLVWKKWQKDKYSRSIKREVFSFDYDVLLEYEINNSVIKCVQSKDGPAEFVRYFDSDGFNDFVKNENFFSKKGD